MQILRPRTKEFILESLSFGYYYYYYFIRHPQNGRTTCVVVSLIDLFIIKGCLPLPHKVQGDTKRK